MLSPGRATPPLGSVGAVFDPEVRASNQDRERTVEILRANLVEGRLTLDEFGDRAELAFSAQTGADLVKLTSDLPAMTPAVKSSPARSKRRTSRVTLSVFAHTVRSGRMRLRRRTVAVSVFSDVDLDLRQAEIESNRTTVTVLAVFGNVDVYVPASINVDAGGITIFGHRRTRGQPTGPPTAPAIYVRVLSVFGTTDVWHVPADVTGTYGEIIRQVKDRHRALGR